MPELPEVETMRRGVAVAVGCRIQSVERTRCRLRPIAIAPGLAAFRRRAVGQRIVAAERVGKRVVLRLEGDDRIVLEPRMTGLVLVADPPNREHLRFRLALSDGRAQELLFWDRRGLGSVRLVSPAEYEARYGLRQLGPDALEVTAALLRQRLGRTRRAIKVALLDQRAVAGIGNLYASEILHLCRVHPARRASGLKAAEWDALSAAVQHVLRLAIRYEGSTLADGTYRNALNEAGGYQNHHQVYDRAGQPCPRCREATIRRIVQAQRSTFYCPACQRGRGVRQAGP
jgi:formamidopyrimidine-DNA glycosylase